MDWFLGFIAGATFTFVINVVQYLATSVMEEKGHPLNSGERISSVNIEYIKDGKIFIYKVRPLPDEEITNITFDWGDSSFEAPEEQKTKKVIEDDDDHQIVPENSGKCKRFTVRESLSIIRKYRHIIGETFGRAQNDNTEIIICPKNEGIYTYVSENKEDLPRVNVLLDHQGDDIQKCLITRIVDVE